MLFCLHSETVCWTFDAVEKESGTVCGLGDWGDGKQPPATSRFLFDVVHSFMQTPSHTTHAFSVKGLGAFSGL